MLVYPLASLNDQLLRIVVDVGIHPRLLEHTSHLVLHLEGANADGFVYGNPSRMGDVGGYRGCGQSHNAHHPTSDTTQVMMPL